MFEDFYDNYIVVDYTDKQEVAEADKQKAKREFKKEKRLAFDESEERRATVTWKRNRREARRAIQ